MKQLDILILVGLIILLCIVTYIRPLPILYEWTGVTIMMIAIVGGTLWRPLAGLAIALIFIVARMRVSKDLFSDYETQDSGEYIRVMENQVLQNPTTCATPSHKNLADAIESCNVCADCSGITYMNGNFELRKGPQIVDAPENTIATTWLKPTDPNLKGDYIGLNIPGATEAITEKLVPNCRERCNADAINTEFQEKRITFFGLPKDTPDMPIIKTAFEPAQTKPIEGGGEWKADEAYVRVPTTLDRCSVSYLLDPDSRNEWVMDAYMNPMEQCRIQVLAQNPFNVFDGKPVSTMDAYGGEKSLFGPMSFRESLTDN